MLQFPQERGAGMKRTAIYREKKNKNIFWALVAR